MPAGAESVLFMEAAARDSIGKRFRRTQRQDDLKTCKSDRTEDKQSVTHVPSTGVTDVSSTHTRGERSAPRKFGQTNPFWRVIVGREGGCRRINATRSKRHPHLFSRADGNRPQHAR